MSAPRESAPARRRPAWYRRIAVRMALFWCVALVTYDLGREPIHEAIVRAIGLPARDEFLIVLSTPIEDLLGDAKRHEPGVWEPTEVSRQIFDQRLREQGFAYVWLDGSGVVLARSPILPWNLGEEWSQPMRSHIDLELDAKRGLWGHAYFLPVERAGELAGTLLCLRLFHGPPSEDGVDTLCPAGERSLVLSPDEFEQLSERQLGLARLVSAATLVAIALLASLVISRLVTRRLTRLSGIAASPLGAGRELPGPFDARGRDEIALLAAGMNSMRARVLELLQGLAERDARRREWVAQVSHDLRTPLTALVACLDRAAGVLESDGPQAQERARELLAVARLDAGRVGALAEDLLDIARLEASDALVLEPVPPGELVRQVARELGPLAEAHGLALEVEVEPRLPTLEADGRRLLRALENLCRNAIQHARATVRLVARRTGGELLLEVHDDGPGLPEREGRIELDALALHRSRADSAGLGLRVAARVAEAHGGSLAARNRARGGGVVWIALPSTSAPPTAMESD